MKVKDRGDRRWYVNGQGQTFAVIDGPVEFRMGSPPTDEPERAGGDNDQPPRRMGIPRRFAIAAKEVTVEQFQRFLKTNSHLNRPLPTSRRASSASTVPDPGRTLDRPRLVYGGPLLQLAERAGGSAQRPVVLSAAKEAGYADGMSIPADVLLRTGYRLPTEAEWEYACRAGTVTSRYYGHSIGPLALYARYSANSREHAWACGGLLPNDLGLFDMLGNEFEWVHDRDGFQTRPQWKL